MAFCSCGACLAPRGPSSPRCGRRGAGAAHPHQQLGPGSTPAAAGNLLYIDSFRVVFRLFIDYWGFGFVWVFFLKTLLLECGFSFLLPFNYL